MPRVIQRTKTTRGRESFHCRGCSEPIVAGQSYYTWASRTSGVSYMHTEHGFPRPSMLYMRKTAQIEDALLDFPNEVDSIDDIQSALSDVASVATDVASEYEESASNMPENLQYGSQAEAMREVARELEDYAQNLEQWQPSADDPADNSEELDENESLQEAREEWLSQMLDEARSDADEIPEYQG